MKLRRWALLSAALLAVVVPIAVVPDAPAGAATACSSSFEGGPDGFSSWWSGTAAPVATGGRSAPGALLLSGSPATAERPATGCDGARRVLVWMRTTAGAARVFVKLRHRDGGADVSGPSEIATAWTPVYASSTIEVTAVGIEAYPTEPGAEVVVDDVELSADPAAPVPVGTTACRDSFETGVDGWLRWWSGYVVAGPSGVAHTGSGALQLSPPAVTAEAGPATAEKLVSPTSCGAPIGSITFWARTTGAGAVLYVKLSDLLTRTDVLEGPFGVDATWRKFTVSQPIAGNTMVRLEAYTAGPEMSVLIDDIEFDPAPAGPQPTPVPVTSPPTTLAPNVGSPCLIEDFATSPNTTGWAPWHGGGTVDHLAGSLSLRGNPATAQRIVSPSECAVPISGIELTLQASAGPAPVFVKTIDQVTGAEQVWGPWTADAQRKAITLPAPITHPTFVGIEAYAGMGGPTVLQSNPFQVLRVSLLSRSGAPPSTTPGTTTPGTTTPTTTPPTAPTTTEPTPSTLPPLPLIQRPAGVVQCFAKYAGSDPVGWVADGATDAFTDGLAATGSAGIVVDASQCGARQRRWLEVFLEGTAGATAIVECIPVPGLGGGQATSFAVTLTGSMDAFGGPCTASGQFRLAIHSSLRGAPSSFLIMSAVLFDDPPTTEAPCIDDAIGADGGQFVDWYTTVGKESLAQPSSESPDGWVASIGAGTARRIIPNSVCNVDLVKVRLKGPAGGRAYLFCGELGTSRFVSDFLPYTGGWDEAFLDCPVTSAGVLFGVASYGPPDPAGSQFAPAILDGFRAYRTPPV